MTSRRRLICLAPALLLAVSAGAACSGSDADAPGGYSFPRVGDGHQYYISEEERAKLQEQAAAGYTPTPTSGS
ncbi:MAG: hypothetical protein OXP73_09110 [Chloroflexota bacterium]|nr:hypothetical protein [Chloroflexota bacterium]